MKNTFKHFIIFVLSIGLILIPFNNSKNWQVYASDSADEISADERKEATDFISKAMCNLEGYTINVVGISLLYDIDDNPTFILANLEPQGYAIFTRGNYNLSEYSMDKTSPYSEFTNRYNFYYGPNNYFSYNTLNKSGSNSKLYSNSNENSNLTENQIRNVTQELINRNNSNISLFSANGAEPFHTPEEYSFTWTGVSETAMQRYNWPQFQTYIVGNMTGICGTVSSTILLSYYDDYINDNIVPSVVRTRNSIMPEMLYECLWYKIDLPHQTGTYPQDLANGINGFFDQYEPHFGSHGWRAVSYIGPTMIITKPFLQNNRPFVLGLLAVLQSPYNNHWVCAYAYSNDDNNSYYKCIDTWAGYTTNNDGAVTYPMTSNNYRAVIYKSWSSSAVYLQHS